MKTEFKIETAGANPGDESPGHFLPPRRAGLLACAIAVAFNFSLFAQASDGSGPEISVPKTMPADAEHALPTPNWIDQSQAEADKKSRGCLECHVGSESMHASPHVVLGCTDCHGGNPASGLKQTQAHVAPRNPVFWQSSANPNDSTVLLNHESAEFIQFVNPGDLRVVEKTCAPCHADIVHNVSHSMMRHGAMLWGAALYNNGASPDKNYRFGQAYGADGTALRLDSPVPVTTNMTDRWGILPFIDPLPRFEIVPPSNLLRIFDVAAKNNFRWQPRSL